MAGAEASTDACSVVGDMFSRATVLAPAISAPAISTASEAANGSKKKRFFTPNSLNQRDE
jgi:hypothetical protein